MGIGKLKIKNGKQENRSGIFLREETDSFAILNKVGRFVPLKIKRISVLEKVPTVLGKFKQRFDDRLHVILSYEGDGVYLTVINSKVSQTKLTKDALVNLLLSKKLENLQLYTIMSKKDPSDFAHVKLASAQRVKWSNEQFSLTFGDRNIEVFMTLLPPDKLGKKLSVAQIQQAIMTQHNIEQSTIILRNIENLISHRIYHKKTMVARGIDPQPPVDGYLKWHVHIEADADIQQKWENLEGNADFKELHLFQSVEKGQLLVECIAPTEGVPGKDVFAEPISVTPGKAVKLPSGINVSYSDDKTKLVATCGGRVEMKKDWVVVNSRYVVEGDVDMSVGNITFPGDLVVHGNVLAGFTIRTGGNIEIFGNVEAATIITNKKLVMYNGVQGGGTAFLSAGDNIRAQFIENATVDCRGNVYAESIIQSNISCDGFVEVLKNKGSIIGGHVCAGQYIAARNIGSSGGTTTEVEIGATQSMLKRIEEYQNLSKQCESKSRYLRKFTVVSEDAQGRPVTKIRFEKEIAIIEAKNKDLLGNTHEIKGRIADMEQGKIHIINTAHPNCIIKVAGIIKSLNTQEKFTTFYKDSGEVKLAACQFIET